MKSNQDGAREELEREVKTAGVRLPFKPEKGESHKAFESFLCYFDIGQNRSCARVGREMGIHPSTIKRWSRRYQWSERIRAYDEDLLGTRVEAEREARRESAQVWSERTLELKEREWAAAEELLGIAQQVLESFGEREVSEISLTEAAKALEIASRIGRLATGLATESQEVTGPGGGAIRIEVEAALDKIYGKPIPGEVVVVEEIREQKADSRNESQRLLETGGRSGEALLTLCPTTGDALLTSCPTGGEG